MSQFRPEALEQIQVGKTDNLAEEVAQVMKDLAPDSCFVQNYYSIPFPEEPKLTLPTAPIEIAKNTHPDDFSEFLEEINVTEDEIRNLADGTTGQSMCEEWHKQRIGRVTASKFNGVANAIDKKNDEGAQKINREIMGYGKKFQNRAMKYGISAEFENR